MVMQSERRKHPRFNLPCRVKIAVPDHDKDLRVRSVNVSAGGLCCLVAAALSPGTDVFLRVAVPRDTANTFFLEKFSSAARVVRIDPPRPDEPEPRVALQFMSPLPVDLP